MPKQYKSSEERAAYNKDYYAKNKERLKALRDARYQNNREDILATKKAQRKADPEKFSIQQKINRVPKRANINEKRREYYYEHHEEEKAKSLARYHGIKIKSEIKRLDGEITDVEMQLGLQEVINPPTNYGNPIASQQMLFRQIPELDTDSEMLMQDMEQHFIKPGND